MVFNERNIFLFDGVGAVLSALFTGLLLPLLSQWTGLPSSILYCLAVFPLIYCIYSLSCYWFVANFKPRMLLAIIIANIFYCVLSGWLIFTVDSITIWGQALLVGEIAVIIGVVTIELKIYRRASR